MRNRYRRPRGGGFWSAMASIGGCLFMLIVLLFAVIGAVIVFPYFFVFFA